MLGIFERDESRVLGGSGLHTRHGPEALEIGYWLRADSEGKGLASEAAAALTRVAFERCGVDRVEVRIDPANERSQRVPERLGFTHEATLRRRLPGKLGGGDLRDAVIFSMFASEFPASPCASVEYRAFDAAGRPLRRALTHGSQFLERAGAIPLPEPLRHRRSAGPGRYTGVRPRLRRARPPRRLAHLEAALTFGLFLRDRHVVDASPARALAAEVDQPLDLVRLALEDRFDRPVGPVRDPARHAAALRESPHRVAEEHALDVPANHDPPPNRRHRSEVSRTLASCS